MNEIGAFAFEGCKSLNAVYCYAENVPETDNSFDQATIEKATLYVPATSVESYRTAPVWSKFARIVALPDEATAVSGIDSQTNGQQRIYGIDGRQLSRQAKGISIIRYQDGTTKKVLR